MAKTKWKAEEALIVAESVLGLAKTDNATLEQRLQSGCLAGLAADTALLRTGTAVVTSAQSTKVAARMSKDELIAGTGEVVMAVREALKRCRVDECVARINTMFIAATGGSLAPTICVLTPRLRSEPAYWSFGPGFNCVKGRHVVGNP